MNRTKFPVRITPDDIAKNRNKFKAYAVLPVPKHYQSGIQFDTIGVTTFKKYIIRTYETLLAQKAFTFSDCWDTPFIISTEDKIPRVVNIQSDTQTQAQPNKQKTPRPPVLNNISQPTFKIQTQPSTQPTHMQSSMDFTQDVGSYYALPHRK